MTTSNQTNVNIRIENQQLASAISKAANPGDEVIYLSTANLETAIETAGVVPVRVAAEGNNVDMALFVKALSARTRAVVIVGDVSKALLAALTRLIATARNIFGQPVTLITEDTAGFALAA